MAAFALIAWPYHGGLADGAIARRIAEHAGTAWRSRGA
jgi:hypothetical protein